MVAAKWTKKSTVRKRKTINIPPVLKSKFDLVPFLNPSTGVFLYLVKFSLHEPETKTIGSGFLRYATMSSKTVQDQRNVDFSIAFRMSNQTFLLLDCARTRKEFGSRFRGCAQCGCRNGKAFC